MANEENSAAKKVSVSVRPELWRWASRRASDLGFESVSAYIAQLVRQDRSRGGDFVIPTARGQRQTGETDEKR